MEIKFENDDGEEEIHTLPSKMEVCYDCAGESYVLTEGMRGHAYSSEEFHREFDDEEAQQYFTRGGIYDVLCPTCKGKNVIAQPDLEQISKNAELQAIYDTWQEYEEDNSYYDRCCRMEREMGA